MERKNSKAKNKKTAELSPSPQRRNSGVMLGFGSSGSVTVKDDDEEDPYLLNDNYQVDPSKGRITVFSISGCAQCRAAKGLLEEHGVEHVEINLEEYPQCRDDFARLTNDKHSVPQIFFNDEHIGGLEALKAIIREGKLQELVHKVESSKAGEGTPALPNIRASNKKDAAKTDILCEQDPYWELIELMRKSPQDGGLVKDRSHLFRKCKACFVGSEAVDFFIAKGYAQDRAAGVEFGNMLFKRHYFSHVNGEHPFLDEAKFYRFMQDEDFSPLTLNTSNTSSCEPIDAVLLGADLRKAILAIYGQYLNAEGTAVDYAGIEGSDLWTQYKKRAAQLQRVILTDMPEDEKMAFFINIYNVMVIHANVEVGAPRSALQRYKYFSKVSYIIGGNTYSLNDVEHGILRANGKPPFGRKPHFKPHDVRIAYCMEKCDPRLHFTLVCGAKSCPAIKTYTANNLERALDMASRSFFEDGACIIDIKKKEVKLSKILYWYGPDFGATDTEKLQFVASFLPEEDEKTAALKEWLQRGDKIKVSYLKYDWSLNKQ